MSLNLWSIVNAQQESVNKNFELQQQNISYLQKELTSKSETIKSLLEVQSVLIESLIKTAVNDYSEIRTNRTPLLSLKLQISRLFRARSSLTFRQL